MSKSNIKRFFVKKEFLLAIFFLIIYFMSTPAHAGMIGQINPENRENNRYKQAMTLEQEVIILYDQFDTRFYNVASDIWENIKAAYTNTRIIGVRSLAELETTVKSNVRALAIIWFIDTNMQGFKLKSNEVLLWEDVADLIAKQFNTHHIIGVGNTDTLQSIMNHKNYPIENLHTQPVTSGLIDLKISFFYALWELSDILTNVEDLNHAEDYNKVGENMRNLALQFLEKDFNDLYERNAEFKDPIGELNETDQLVKYEEVKNRFPSEILSRAKFNTIEGQKAPPLAFKSNYDQLGIGDVLLSAIPLTSGLQGPIGFILDGLFDLLLKSGDSDIVISEDTVQLIFDAFKIITSLVGGEGFDAGAVSSALKSLLKVLTKEFPFGEQLLPYAELILDGLFALKGDEQTIKNFIDTLLNLVLDFTDLSSGDKSNIKTVINSIFDFTGDFIDAIHNGEEVLSALMKSLTSNMFLTFADKLINETLGIPNAIATYKPKLEAVVNTIIQLFSSDIDVAKILDDNLENLINIALGLIPSGNAQDIVKKLSSVLTFAMAIVRQGQDKLLDRAKTMLDELLPGITDKAKVVEDTAKAIIDKIGEIREKGISSVNTIVNDVSTIINSITGISTELTDLLKKTTTWVFGVLADKIPDNERNNLPDIEEILDVFLTYVDTVAAPANVDIPLSRMTIEEIEVAGVTAVPLDPAVKDGIKKVVKYATGLFAFLADPTDKIKKFYSQTVDKFKNTFEKDPVGAVVDVLKLVFGDNNTIITTHVSKLETYAKLAISIFKIIKAGSFNSFQGAMQVITTVVGTGIFKNFDVDLEPYIEVINNLFPDVMGIANAPTPFEAAKQISTLLQNLPAFPGQGTVVKYAEAILGVMFNVREIFTNGLQWIFGQIVEWLGRKVEELVNQLLDTLISAIGGSEADNLPPIVTADYDREIYENVSQDRFKSVTNHGDRHSLTTAFGDPLIELELGAELGGFSLFSLYIGIGLKANFAFDTEAFKDMIVDVVFKGKKLFGDGDFGDFIGKIFSFMEITPLITATIELGGFGSGKNSFMDFLLINLGLKLDFSGSGYFAMNLFTFKGGEFKLENFLKIVEWGFTFTITLSKTLTLLDFLTAGVGGGALSAAAEYLGLGGITVTITLALTVEIFKRAASASGPEEASFTLKISIGVMVKIGFDLVIVAIELWGGVEIILTFFQDLADKSAPLKVFLELIFRFGVTLTFLFWDFDASWEFGKKWDLTPQDETSQKENGGKGFDADDDGLGDEYEASVPGLDPNSADSDGDMLSDKEETQIWGTDPTKADSDDDGLDDFIEIKNTKTDPKNRDSDYDGLTDYEESIIYNTNPNQRDTDGDGLDDNFEVNHAWNISWPLTPTVREVIIGGKSYNDHTDPLIPDTDGDGLLDGQEGERGPWYGSPMLAPEYIKGLKDANNQSYDIIFNGGWTHPLDNDTDDDSYEQLVNGTISYRYLFMRDMTDGVEVFGQDIIFYVEGEPELRHVITNPVRPDTDGDTGYTSGLLNPGPINRFLNSDGYELSLTPPSDPNDGDTDDDGLIDGLEGTLAYDSNRTNYNNWDTDGDGLGDMQEVLLGTDPMDVDTDKDLVTDGDEYFKFGTSPFLSDTDFDGLLDGHELFWFHTSPFLYDSDGDGLGDAAEIFDYYSDPNDDDTDNDFVSDFEEVMIYFTLVNVADTDNDGLLDGIELFTYKTSPFMWDTDNDSIYYPDPTTGSGISMRWGDFEEIEFNQSDPTIPDSDTDGIGDGWEVYLGLGHIPFMDPILLDLKNNDTDGDGLLDGQEMIVANTTNLIFPFVSFFLVYPFKTSPVLADTDGDGLTDTEELNIYLTFPNIVDSDNDTLTDYEEVIFHKTSPLKADTDGDGLNDNEERTMATVNGVPAGSLYDNGDYIVYSTDALNPDTDGDWLPDGAEIQTYLTDPLDPDEFTTLSNRTGNGVLDGLDLDSDADGLPDGYEYTANNTNTKIYGINQMLGNTSSAYPFEGSNGTVGVTNPFNPDSDSDSLPDGLEVFNFGTNPTMNDTDLDNLSDGLEIRIGTDPLNATDWTTFLDKMTNYTVVMINSPVPASYIGSAIPLKVYAPANSLQVNYKTYNGLTGQWTQETSMIWDAKEQIWTIPSLYKKFEPGLYYFKAFAYLDSGEVITDGLSFAVQEPYRDISDQLNNADTLLSDGSGFVFIFIGLLSGLATTVVYMNKNSLLQGMKKLAKKYSSNKEDIGE